MPSPRTYSSVLAVPRSMAMSRPPIRTRRLRRTTPWCDTGPPLTPAGTPAPRARGDGPRGQVRARASRRCWSRASRRRARSQPCAPRSRCSSGPRPSTRAPRARAASAPRAGRRAARGPRAARPPPDRAPTRRPPPGGPSPRSARCRRPGPSAGSPRRRPTPPRGRAHSPPPRTGRAPARPCPGAPPGSRVRPAGRRLCSWEAYGCQPLQRPACAPSPYGSGPRRPRPGPPPRSRSPPGAARRPRAGGPSRLPRLRAWDLRSHRRSASGLRVDLEPSLQHGDPVRQAAQTGAVLGVRAADPVVLHLHHEPPVGTRHFDLRMSRVGVLRDVRECLGDHEVCRELHRLREPAVWKLRQLNRHGRAARERLERGAEPPVSEHGRVDAARELAQLLECRVELRARALEQPVGRDRVLVQLRARKPVVQSHGDETLLGAVVQVALEPAALLEADLEHALPRAAELVDLRAQRRVEAFVLERERGGRS